MIIAILTLLVALAISGVAAWYSIVGLMAIFSSAAFAVPVDLLLPKKESCPKF